MGQIKCLEIGPALNAWQLRCEVAETIEPDFDAFILARDLRGIVPLPRYCESWEQLAD